MERSLFNALLSEDMTKVCEEMILPQRSFVGGSREYNVNLSLSALDVKELLIRTDVWMDTVLEFDENVHNFNRALHVAYSEGNVELWDYQVIDFLNSLGYDATEKYSGYTYNDSDYCRLDRDIHYTVFKYDGDYYVAMRIHCGADARVGFSDTACFKLKAEEYFLHSMNIQAWDSVTDEDYEWFQLEDVAEYNEEIDAWINKENGNEINVHTSADGW